LIYVKPTGPQFLNINLSKSIKRLTNALWFYGCNFIAWWPQTCSSHSCGHLQGGETRLQM